VKKRGPSKAWSVPRAIVPTIAAWFRLNARPLPWREPDPANPLARNPYHSLVSEFMLQQTQVSRVLEKFDPFLARFPTIQSLAAAEIGDVLAEWSGLGYYRRARHLHSAAREVVSRFGGVIPQRVEDLLTLPGIGRYTAGAIASLVHGQPAPIVDGNVMRVFLRVAGRDTPQDSPATRTWAWEQAQSLVESAANTKTCAAFNEGLMELGARVCTPGAPRCDQCPITRQCAAFKLGLQSTIPRPKKRAVRTTITHSSLLLISHDGRLLVEQRPETGLWAGLWQAPTVETLGLKRPPTAAAIARQLHLEPAHVPHRIADFIHNTTHREVKFRAWAASGLVDPDSITTTGQWLTPAQIAALGISNPQRRILLTLGGDLATSLLCARAPGGHHPRVQRVPVGPRRRGAGPGRPAAATARRR